MALSAMKFAIIETYSNCCLIIHMYKSLIANRQMLDELLALYQAFYSLPDTVAERSDLITQTLYLILILNKKHKERNITFVALCIKDVLTQLSDSITKLGVTHEDFSQKAEIIVNGKAAQIKKTVSDINNGKGPQSTLDFSPILPVNTIYRSIGLSIKFGWITRLYNNFANPSRADKRTVAFFATVGTGASFYALGAGVSLFGLSVFATAGLTIGIGLGIGLLYIAANYPFKRLAARVVAYCFGSEKTWGNSALNKKRQDYIIKAISSVNKYSFRLSMGLAKQLVIDNKALNSRVLSLEMQLKKNAEFPGIVPDIYCLSRNTSVESDLLKWLPRDRSSSVSQESDNEQEDSINDHKMK